jgi:hypothetical protein
MKWCKVQYPKGVVVGFVTLSLFVFVAFSSKKRHQSSPRPVRPSVAIYSPMVQLTAWLVGAMALAAMVTILWSNPDVPAVHTPS